MNKIFLDSSFIIALVNENDDLHEKAKELVKTKILQENEIYISNLIINEVITVVGNIINTNVAIDTYNLLVELCIILNEYKENNFNNNVINYYSFYKNKLSFVDCSRLELMKIYDIPYLVSYDKEFKRVNEIELIN
ncbi:type II toxin-antitoxin system VapC family toxin [Methanosphaera sp. WGK6]|uniref:type II toxin-antitoxin system VapC family toxin n=1 Tax=Methanosphaera sp. WGK6 TaxID=1561964 RepID=UPI00084C953D|nr:PIN domain-containing protein [Methanosphaera sp. WGK6]OED30409.1 hypothetical protein NL43_03330 [Methanosphaera sp. WGK6]